MKTILLVDGDAAWLGQVAEYLRDHGWHVWTAPDGVVAFEMALRERPMVVACDLQLPRMNGFQLFRQLREKSVILAGLRIVAVSGSIYATDRQNAMESGADLYLLKPIRLDELEYQLSMLFSKPDTSKNPVAAVPASPAHAASSSPSTPYEDGGTVRVKFWGVRGSIATPGADTVYFGGNTSCVEVRADGEIVVLDAGTGIRPLGRSMVKEFQGRSLRMTLLLSHTHWDHIQGFPFFIPAYNPKNDIRIMGCEGASSGLNNVLSSQMESPYFPISMHQMPGHIHIEEIKHFDFSLGRVKVQSRYVNHPGLCLGFRLNTSAGAIVYLPDNEPFSRLRTIPNYGYDHLAYAQQQDSRLIEFMQGAEVLIMDSQYDDAEYQTHVGWGHGCVDDVVALAILAKVKKLYLFHHDPDHDDEHIHKMVQWARELVMVYGESLEVEAAREGVEIILNPVEAEVSPAAS